MKLLLPLRGVVLETNVRIKRFHLKKLKKKKERLDDINNSELERSRRLFNQPWRKTSSL